MKLTVEGMSCGHCIHAITQAVLGRDPAAHVTVDLSTHTVGVTGASDADAVVLAIEAEGYRVVAREDAGDVRSPVSAACCGSCHA